MKIKKIYIVGSPGGGKSTLAKALSKKLGIPWIETDTISQPWIGDSPTAWDKRIRQVKKLSTMSRWIADGICVAWTKEFFEQADLIIYLALPLWVTIPRVLWRYLLWKVRGQSKYRFIDQMRLPFWMVKYYYQKYDDLSEEDSNLTKRKTEIFLQHYQHKLIVLTNTREIEQLMKSDDIEKSLLFILNPPSRNSPIVRSWDAKIFSASADFSSDEARAKLPRP